ncbi:hypothetical protein J437_LFUL006115 [Ladona fulva]|uniref:G-protein coupled receptors family 1 profile domain-containing protein n=1 Tax=Ladona fulva TaxID=123851 RepID=A0A8K0K979_LADFU|nr:hypothetical protein J437_LFUL006115 [Ladona fulva]
MARGRHRGMRTRTNLFLANLALADILVGLLDMPFSVLTLIFGEWRFGHHMSVNRTVGQTSCQSNEESVKRGVGRVSVGQARVGQLSVGQTRSSHSPRRLGFISTSCTGPSFMDSKFQKVLHGTYDRQN